MITEDKIKQEEMSFPYFSTDFKDTNVPPPPLPAQYNHNNNNNNTEPYLLFPPTPISPVREESGQSDEIQMPRRASLQTNVISKHIKGRTASMPLPVTVKLTREESFESNDRVSLPDNSGGYKIAGQTDVVGAKCAWENCTSPHTSETPYRKVVSDCFGRNVSALKGDVPWIFVCRRRYQRQTYSGGQLADELRATMFQKQLELWKDWGGFTYFKVKQPESLAGDVPFDFLLDYARQLKREVMEGKAKFPKIRAYPKCDGPIRSKPASMHRRRRQSVPTTTASQAINPPQMFNEIYPMPMMDIKPQLTTMPLQQFTQVPTMPNMQVNLPAMQVMQQMPPVQQYQQLQNLQQFGRIMPMVEMDPFAPYPTHTEPTYQPIFTQPSAPDMQVVDPNAVYYPRESLMPSPPRRLSQAVDVLPSESYAEISEPAF